MERRARCRESTPRREGRGPNPNLLLQPPLPGRPRHAMRLFAISAHQLWPRRGDRPISREGFGCACVGWGPEGDACPDAPLSLGEDTAHGQVPHALTVRIALA